MANIELVIKIDEDIYKLGNSLIFPLLNKDKAKAFQDMMVKAITNGIPLPKGHGRLIDAKEYENSIRKHYFDNSTVIRCTEIALYNALTIIEADKESEDAKQ